MPSARQIANGLARRGVTREAAAAVNLIQEVLLLAKDPETASYLLRHRCTPGQLQLVRETIDRVLDVMSEVERTHNHSRVLTADIPRTRRETVIEQ